MPNRRPRDEDHVKIGISITAASPAATPIRNGPPPAPSIWSGTKPSVEEVAKLSSSNPPRNAASPGDVRNAAPIAPSRVWRSAVVGAAWRRESGARTPRSTTSAHRVERQHRPKAHDLIERAEQDHGDRPAETREATDPTEVVGARGTEHRKRQRVAKGRAGRRGRCHQDGGGRDRPRRPSRPGSEGSAHPAVASVESTSARVVPSRVSASWLHSGAATTVASAIADSTSPMRSGDRPRACSSGVKNGQHGCGQRRRPARTVSGCRDRAGHSHPAPPRSTRWSRGSPSCRQLPRHRTRHGDEHAKRPPPQGAAVRRQRRG